MNYEGYHIPVKFTEAGKLSGLFEVHKTVGSLLLKIPVLFFCHRFLTLGITTRIVVTLTLVVPLGGFSLLGIQDDSLTRWLGGWIKWRRQRRRMLYRGEVSQ